jgi:hypothetical protein
MVKNTNAKPVRRPNVGQERNENGRHEKLRNGSLYVEKDSKMGYINTEGEIVYME